ncbi:thioesterase-like superfamily-domain-containing protein [Hypoxylon sp. NC0597]|nr:thioesterase-like superfamily-domain-containing protein [Hypoxylon sp. NC0597]
MPPRPRLKLSPNVLPLRLRSPRLGIGSATTNAHSHRIELSSSSSSSSTFLTSTSLSRAYSSSSTEQPPPAPPSRWYSDLKARLGKCIMFGCSREQAQQAASVLEALATEWRGLTAGAEGFLTGGRRGLENQQVVWGEMDSFGHVNNTNYIRYAESARVNWIIHFASVDPANGTRWRELMKPKGTGLIMKSIKAEYKFPMTYPDTISAYHKLRSLPSATDTSLILDCIILSHNHKRVAARTEEDIVIYDYKAARKTVVPPFALDTFRDIWRLQEEEIQRARARIWSLVGQVEVLEKETWDKPDAIEDMGAAVKGTR